MVFDDPALSALHDLEGALYRLASLIEGDDHAFATVAELLDGVERAVEEWEGRVDALERSLVATIAAGGDGAADARKRLAALALLETAVAADLGRLARFDALPPEEQETTPVGYLGPPGLVAPQVFSRLIDLVRSGDEPADLDGPDPFGEGDE